MRMTSLSRLLMLGLLIAGTASAHADSRMAPAQWLERMTEATRQTNYRGVVMYHSGEMMETMSLVHRYKDGEVRERIFSMSGEPREILRKGDEVTCIIPREKKVTIDKLSAESLFPKLPPSSIEQMQQNYELHDMGQRRLAGRTCRGIRIKARDGFRYGYEIWLDEATAVPVKMSLLDQDGAMLEEVMFTQVEFPETISDEALLPELDHKGYKFYSHSQQPAQLGGTTRWSLSGAPPGFKVNMRDVREMPDGAGTVEHLMLSDGLSTVSVYSTSMPKPDQVYEGLSRMGAVHTYGRMVGDYHLTVVGEVPAATVEMIGENLHLPDAKQSKQ